ncbi:hypothetical protein [Tenacibaculum caenipelagi]|uniref:Uncharacterized protein n=1 Tax=Tenacibaculum caenipelagi TaxID=1325435 RepID=A0A4R6TF82_9FLAO|nr:hypothetical protein [Tenacibaculum caenipelagi]TDQ28618.1 hypothetical protein DFQ07_0995 [Tenacibaculum caenipelagi]
MVFKQLSFITSLKKIILFIAFLITPLMSISQNTDDLILKIRTEFQRINSNNQLEKIELFNEEFMGYRADGGGQLTGYFENNKLVKITEWIGPSYGSLITESYFKDNQLFFVYQKENKFKDILDNSGEWIGLDASKEETKFEGRYYFDKNILIKQLLKGKRVFNQIFKPARFIEHTNSTAELLRKRKTTQNKQQ